MLTIHNCLRCGYEWASRRVVRPQNCAKCKSKYWWREARRTDSPNKIHDAVMGRPRKYPVDVLRVGQSMTLEYDLGDIVSMRQCVFAFARRSGREFRTESTKTGLLVERIK